MNLYIFKQVDFIWRLNIIQIPSEKWLWAFDSYWLLEKMTWNIKINKLWLSMPNQKLLIVKAARHIEKFHVLSSGSFAAYPIKHCTVLQYCGKRKQIIIEYRLPCDRTKDTILNIYWLTDFAWLMFYTLK